MAFIERVDGSPSVGTFRTVYKAEARLASDASGEYADTTITGVGDDFFATNQFGIALAAPEYTLEDGVDSAAVWRAVQANPGLAVVNATIVPTRNNSAFGLPSEQFTLDGVEGLLVENDDMAPVDIAVRDLESGNTLELKVIGVLDTLASTGPVPVGFYVSPETLGREVNATQLFFNLLIGFMSLGLLVGIAALGVISARTVVERRHGIGVLRAIGFSPGWSS